MGKAGKWSWYPEGCIPPAVGPQSHPHREKSIHKLPAQGVLNRIGIWASFVNLQCLNESLRR